MLAATEEEPEHHTWHLLGALSDPALINYSSWCALLGKDRNCLYGNWLQENRSDGKVAFETTNDPLSVTAGARLPFAGDIHAWAAILIEDGLSVWEEHVFVPRDAIATHFTGHDGNAWRGLRPVASDEQPAPDAEIVESGWDHEHCLICNGHIDPGDRFFQHKTEDNYFLCTTCYENHAKTGDLSFLLPNGDQ